MALKQGAFPYDIDNLLGGAVRIAYARLDVETPVAVPTDLTDIFDLTSPYALADGWEEFGATSENFTYSRGFATEGYEIQQEQAAVIEEITEITRTIQVSMAEFDPEHLRIFENAPEPGQIAAAAGRSAQDVVSFGGFSSAASYRFAFIARRNTKSGIVREGAAGRTRGRFFGGVLFNASVSADDVSMEIGKGQLAAAGLTFQAFPDATQPEGEEYGAWFDERPGTIAAV